MKDTDTIHQESIEYISNSISAKTSEIPRHLLEYWYVPEDIADYFEKSSNLHAFFIFQHAFEFYNKTLGKEIGLSSIEIMGLFGQFQLIINAAIHPEMILIINQIELFDFGNYSKLNITVL